MKKSLFIVPAIAVLLAAPLAIKDSYQQVLATGHRITTNGNPTLVTSLPTYIDLNPVSTDDIRDYYSPLNALSESERQGTNLLKNLKTILKDMNYYKYGGISSPGVTYIYTITDRDWEHSPATSIVGGTYDSGTNTISNFNYKTEVDADPYVKMLYVDYTKQETTKFKNGTKPNFDKEHVWCQSRGFKGKSETASGPAGTDLHHLIAGDSQVNQSIHNDNPYGFVNTASSHGNKTYTSENLLGSPKHTSVDDEYNAVFEPQDCEKGDIARAIFYMAARYNNYSGSDTITDYEPYLALVNHVSGSGKAVYSTATTPVTMGILSDLLAWNKLDPVDDYEIHRNDLIYRNFQGNRNPFIDFPEWADYIWGTTDLNGENYNSAPTSYAKPASDSINDKSLSVDKTDVILDVDESTIVKATTADNSGITWTVANTSIATINKTSTTSGEALTITAKALGKTTLTANATVNGEPCSKEIIVDVKTLTGISVSGGTREFKVNEAFNTNGLIVNAKYNDNSTSVVATGDYTVSTPDMSSDGTKTVTVTYKGFEATYTINVTKPNYILYIAIGGGVLLVAIIVIIIYTKGSKKTKKAIKKAVKSGVKSYSSSSSSSNKKSGSSSSKKSSTKKKK